MITEISNISRFSIPQLSELPIDIRKQFIKVQEKIGFIPNVFFAFANRPQEYRAFFSYHDALINREGGLSHSEKEMIIVATSSLNECQYCVIAHGAILRVKSKSPYLADQVASNYRKADISLRQKLILDFAIKVATSANKIDDSDFVKLEEVGLTEDDIWDITSITAFFGMSNRIANVASLRANKEFYSLGR